MTALVHAEFLYELWDANWDDGPLGNYQIRRYEITRKTAKRIYFSLGYDRFGFVDRQRIEADGQVFYRQTNCRLYLTPPEIPTRPKRPSLPELRKAMAAAHPDRGGTDEAFIVARRRYEHARSREAS